MRFRLLPYVTLEVDDRLRQRLRSRGERLRVNVRAYLRSAADDVDEAGEKVRGICNKAVHRVDSVVATVNDKIAPMPPQPDARQGLAIFDEALTAVRL